MDKKNQSKGEFPSNVPDIRDLQLIDRDKELYELKQDIKEIKDKIIDIHNFQGCLTKLLEFQEKFNQTDVKESKSEQKGLKKKQDTNDNMPTSNTIDNLLETEDDMSTYDKSVPKNLNNSGHQKKENKAKQNFKKSRNVQEKKEKSQPKPAAKISRKRSRSTTKRKSQQEDTIKNYRRSDLLSPKKDHKVNKRKQKEISKSNEV